MDYGAVLMDTEIIEKIKFVLKDKIAPSVAAHGGKIEFKSLPNSIAYRSEEFDIFLLSPQIVTGPFILLDALPEPILAKNDALVKKKSFFSKLNK